MSRRLSRGVAIIIVMAGAVSLRVFFSGLREYRAGSASLAAGDAEEAIVRFRRAATWYLPGNPIVGRALGELEAIALANEAAEPRLARRAWEAERSALLGSRHFFVPHGDRLAVANQHIARLLAAEEAQRKEATIHDGSDKNGNDRAATLAYHQRLLDRIPGPSVGWTLLALAGFGLWIAGAVLFIFRGLTVTDALRVRPAFLSGVLIVLGFGVFMLGLSMA